MEITLSQKEISGGYFAVVLKQSTIVNKVWTRTSPILGLLLLSSVSTPQSENHESKVRKHYLAPFGKYSKEITD